MQELVKIAQDAAKKAGEVLCSFYGKGFEISHKGAVDLVTTADKRAEEMITRHIRTQVPSHALLAEESGASRGSSEYTWIIDPLDGTVNFAHHVPHFAVLIGLQRHVPPKSPEMVLGVIYDPMRQEEFLAVAGEGASLNGTPIAVSKTSRLIDALGATGFAYSRLFDAHDNHGEFCRLNLLTQGIRRMGSAGLDLAYVAAGRMDFYWEYGLKPWDYASGVLMVAEAGGVVSDANGGDFEVSLQGGNSSGLLVSNGPLHKSCLRALASAKDLPANDRSGIKDHLPQDVAKAVHPGRQF